ncbi:heavy metal translocating P-type ATPase metal-binding domain-containing protein [Luteolibacter pohnpeiensis]|uniref:Heavy metal translocating P-type ATPase metal-binding domain-containing protein n=1 Tax=Luteolibacter pohnpeiensis TaxID=454153 RepID=A0A934S2R3_9BACT|nr:heavy metal translocating P-type ATPase metal-binding domain-containing protein [Luteolibacter pohnpeiensis]MBK1882100.1 heavy metal translocating P-type ATPase metal-binding domain-containing protein [Luteolibacter pohnpeiensis]
MNSAISASAPPMEATTASCLHCGSHFSPTADQADFCCKGCECVHQLILDQGLDRFYELKAGQVLAPVKSRPFESPDFAWLSEKIAAAEATPEGTSASLDYSLEGLSCVACVWLIERLFTEQPGAIRAVAHPARSTLHLEWQPGACDVTAFAELLVSYGYTPAPSDRSSENRETSALAARTGLCAAFALNAMIFTLPFYAGMPISFELAPLFRLIAFLSATLAMLTGGGWFIARAWRALQMRTLHIDLPIALGLIAAYLGSIVGWALDLEGLLYFDFVCTFVFLMLGGRWLQTLAVEKNRRRIARTSPISETVISNGAPLPLSAIQPETPFELQTGRALPVAATLTSEIAEVSLEWIHGEPHPVTMKSGTVLPAGTILLSRSSVTVVARETWDQSLLSQLTAPSNSEASSPLLTKVLRAYLTAVLIIGMAGLGFWCLRGHAATGVQVMISIFVVSCPCALGIAIPMADERATKFAARAGAFVRNSTFWSRLPRVRKIVFDKTGTLTLERPVLTNPEVLQGLDSDAALALTRLCSGTCHPVSRTLIEALGSRGQKLLQTAKSGPAIAEEPGLGVHLDDHGDLWSLGRPNWKAPGEPGTTVLAKNGILIAAFRFTDSLRPDATKVIQELHRTFQLFILSGDHADKVTKLAGELGIHTENARGGLTSAQKAQEMQQIDHRDTLYLGDGANDSLAFDRALATGTPVADRSLLEKKADFYTLGSGLNWLPQLFQISRNRNRGIHRTFAFTLIYNLIAIAICLTGGMNPLLAAILMPLSSIISIALVTTAK